MIDHPDPIAPGAAQQLALLVLGGVGAVVVVALLVLARGVARWRGHGHPKGPAGTPPDQRADPVGPPEEAPADPVPLRAGGTRLLGAVIVLVLAMPTAAAVRQLWPHPELGWRLLVVWILAWLPPAVAWLALARRGRHHGNDR